MKKAATGTDKKTEEPIRVTLDGKEYRFFGGRWVDKNYMQASSHECRRLDELAEDRFSAGDEELRDPWDMLRAAQKAQATEQFVRAERLARQAGPHEPTLIHAAAVLCSVLRMMGRARQAIRDTQIAADNGGSAALFTSRAAAFCDLSEWEAAKKEADRAWAMDGGSPTSAVYARIEKARPDLFS